MINITEVSQKQIVVVNCIEKRSFRVNNWNIQVECTETQRVLTKLYAYRILVLYIIGHAQITTAAIERLKKMSVPLVVMKPNFRTVFHYAPLAAANFLLRRRQHTLVDALPLARCIIQNKIQNQLKLLRKRRKPAALKEQFEYQISAAAKAENISQLMGHEGICAKLYFGSLFEKWNWKQRLPRIKSDVLNACLDIGYSILFNFIEANLHFFGFDAYVGVCHQAWFQRKSLVCDLIEPFRVVVDHQLLNALNRGTFKAEDFEVRKHQYRLRRGKSGLYAEVFVKGILAQKNAIFLYVRDYYRYFMNKKSVPAMPEFLYE